MRTTKKITQEVTVTDQIFCNKCGENCGLPKPLTEPKVYNSDPYGLIEATVRGGYFSDPLVDQTNYTFSLCEECLHDLFQTFKIPVGLDDYWARCDGMNDGG